MRTLLAIILTFGLFCGSGQADDLPTATDLAKAAMAVDTTHSELLAAEGALDAVKAKHQPAVNTYTTKKQEIDDLNETIGLLRAAAKADETVRGVNEARITELEGKVAELEGEMAELNPDDITTESMAAANAVGAARTSYNEAVSAHTSLVLAIATAAISQAENMQQVIDANTAAITELEDLKARIDAFCLVNPNISLCLASTD